MEDFEHEKEEWCWKKASGRGYLGKSNIVLQSLKVPLEGANLGLERGRVRTQQTREEDVFCSRTMAGYRRRQVLESADKISQWVKILEEKFS